MSQIVLPYCYKITNKTTNQFYIGFRSANKLLAKDDLGFKYFTSSKIVKELGFENFKIDWIEEFENPDQAYRFEQLIISESFKDPLSLNKVCHFGKQKFNTSGSITSKETRQLMSLSAKIRLFNPKNNSMYGKNHTKESKELISKVRKESGIAKGINNPNYGKTGAAAGKSWIHNLNQKHEIYIDINQFHLYLNYSLGRLPSKSKGKRGITNGIINLMIDVDESFNMPTGYRFGFCRIN